MTLVARLLAAVVLATAGGLAPTGPVAAHAVLRATQPADGAVVTAAPEAVTLLFNEPVIPVTLRVIALDGGAPVAAASPRAVDNEVRLTLPAGLPVGGYLVSYRVVSADSHPIGGSFVYSIGAAPVSPGPAASAGTTGLWEELWRVAKMTLRFIQDAALMVAAGGTLLRLLVLGPAMPLPGLTRAIRLGAVTSMAAAVLTLGVQGLLLTAEPAARLFAMEPWRLGAASSVGTTALILVPALIAVVLGTVSALGRAGPWLGAVGALAACAGLALSGHSAAGGRAVQVILALHAVTAAYWLGSLGPLLAILRTRPPAEAAALIRRFSALAVPAVAILLAAGIGTALGRLDNPAALTASDYGRLLLLKLALVVLLVALAAINRWRWTPGLAAGTTGAGAMLARNIRIEFALGAAILFLTAVIGHTPPPDHDAGDHAHPEHHAEHAVHDPGISQRVTVGGRALLLELTPGRTGVNALALTLTQADGQPLAPLEVTLALSAPGIEPLRRVPQATGDGRYALPRVDLPRAGPWTVRVEALISDFEKTAFSAEVTLR